MCVYACVRVRYVFDSVVCGAVCPVPGLFYSVRSGNRYTYKREILKIPVCGLGTGLRRAARSAVRWSLVSEVYYSTTAVAQSPYATVRRTRYVDRIYVGYIKLLFTPTHLPFYNRGLGGNLAASDPLRPLAASPARRVSCHKSYLLRYHTVRIGSPCGISRRLHGRLQVPVGSVGLPWAGRGACA